MLRVKFLTKNIDVGHPNHNLVVDRSADFANFRTAMDFIRNIRSRLTNEVLICRPEIVEIA